MQPLTAHYRDLLRLDGSWAVADVDLSKAQKRVVISLEFTDNQAICPECGAACPLQDHAPQRQWRHLDAIPFETVLAARVPRADCPRHGVRDMVPPSADPHSRFPLMFDAFAIDVLVTAGSVSAAAGLLRLCRDSAHRIMGRAVERGLAVRNMDGLRYLGLDERSFRRGQDYISVVADPDGARVLDVAPGCTGESAGRLWESLSLQQREQIEAVSIDMCQAFENRARQHAPRSDIVYDRFHIARHINAAVDHLRREEYRRRKTDGDEQLSGTRQLWLFHPENLSDSKSEDLEALRRQSLRTSPAWGLTDCFRWFWTCPDADSTRQFFRLWYAWAFRSRLEPVKTVVQMLSSRLDNVLAWFRHRISEGFNSRIQSIKASARGFRTFANYRTRILFFCGRLSLKTTRT